MRMGSAFWMFQAVLFVSDSEGSEVANTQLPLCEFLVEADLETIVMLSC